MDATDAWDELVGALRPQLLRTARAILHDGEQAEDAVQDALVLAHLSRSRLRSGAAAPAWLTRITRNAALARLRAQRRRPTTAGAVPNGTAAPPPRLGSGPGPVGLAVQQLSPKLRQALWLRYVDGIGVDECCRIAGVARETFRSRLRIARQTLREELGNMPPQEHEGVHEDAVVEVPGVSLAPAPGPLIACVQACAQRAGRPLGVPVLSGLFGHAFEATYALGGADVWHSDLIEWEQFGQGLARTGVELETVERIANNPSVMPAPSQREWDDTLQSAYQRIQESVMRGIPALVWQPMSTQQRDTGLPAYGWGVVHGYDAGSGEYLVCHPHAGRYRVHFRSIGKSDPVGWLHVTVFLGPNESFVPAQAALQAARGGIALLTGEVVGGYVPPTPAGTPSTGTLATWQDEAQRNVCPREASVSHATYWSLARATAAGFCEWAAEVAPASAAAFTDAAASFQREAAELHRVAAGDADPKPIGQSVAHENDAVRALRSAVA